MKGRISLDVKISKFLKRKRNRMTRGTHVGYGANQAATEKE